VRQRDFRYQWIAEWIKREGQADVLNSEFVDCYINAVEARFRPTYWGAHKCPALGSDLAHMAKCGALDRFRVGLGANWQPGFPRWVWSYSLGRAAYLYLPENKS